jgi:hypothetical protein
MTDTEEASKDFVDFMRANVAPYDAPDHQREEWPISIQCNDPEALMGLCDRMTKLENLCNALT